MKPIYPSVLAINGGSSSIRFAIYSMGETLDPLLSGKIDRIGIPGTTMTVDDMEKGIQTGIPVPQGGHREAGDFLAKWLEARPDFASIKAIGHRIVHGMKHSEPERVTSALLAELRQLTPYDPEHLPLEIGLIESFRDRDPDLLQIVCFDTAFHRGMPNIAKLLPIPRHYSQEGVERYGFHGLSYSYLMEELARLEPDASKGRTILAHLGNGASLAAVLNGKSIDTSMGFTPAAGMMMSTRSGDLDPGLMSYLARTRHMTAAGFQKMINQESGLLGVSGLSSDIRDLLEAESTDGRAKEAVDLFCYQAKKWIGSFAAALGGLETLVFTGGIGENAPIIRGRICEGLEFLGIHLDPAGNSANLALISSGDGPVKVRVIRTDEERMIALSTSRFFVGARDRQPVSGVPSGSS